MQEEFSINGTQISPGEDADIKLSIGRIPSGTQINLHVHVYRAKKPGPTLLVMGGVHGDEINGIEIVRRAMVRDYFKNLKAGSVIAIPLLNIYGFIHFSRDTPDGKDVNRNFPGSTSGSLSSRVARTLTKKILPLVDVGIDYHTGGGSRYNYPQIRYSIGDARAKELAQTFAAPFLIENKPVAKSLRKVALGQNKPILIYEGGESLRFDGIAIQKGLEGLKRVMAHLGMIKEKHPSVSSKLFTKTTWLRASSAGIFEWFKQSGNYVGLGEKIGVINDPYGHQVHYVIARKEGYIIGHNNAPVVHSGDALFHIGYEWE